MGLRRGSECRAAERPYCSAVEDARGSLEVSKEEELGQMIADFDVPLPRA